MTNLTHTLSAFLLVFSLNCVAQEKKIDSSSLPPAVQKTVQAHSQGATIEGYSTERENGKLVYEAKLIISGHTKDMQIAQDGTLNETEEEVNFALLPAKVQANLKSMAAGAKITKVESLVKHDKLVAYEAATLKGTKTGEIQVGPDGGKLTHEE